MGSVIKTVNGATFKTEKHRLWFMVYRAIVSKKSESESIISLYWDLDYPYKHIFIPMPFEYVVELLNNEDYTLIDIIFENVQGPISGLINKVPMFFP